MRLNVISKVKHYYRYARYPSYRLTYLIEQKKKALLSQTRYTPGIWTILEHPLKFADNLSCYFIYNEIFDKGIYQFETQNKKPSIIDAGANIGLSIIYFKRLFPEAKIIAFEPDDKIFSILAENVASFHLRDIVLEKKALWNEDGWLEFHSEGADAGRVRTAMDYERIVRVPSVRLRKYLEGQTIDFLKVDIEGAETTVLKDCEDLLVNVSRIFVEYHSFTGQEQTLPELLALLKRAGFRLNINVPGLVSKKPFSMIETYNGMDMQLNIYGWRS